MELWKKFNRRVIFRSQPASSVEVELRAIFQKSIKISEYGLKSSAIFLVYNWVKVQILSYFGFKVFLTKFLSKNLQKKSSMERWLMLGEPKSSGQDKSP